MTAIPAPIMERIEAVTGREHGRRRALPRRCPKRCGAVVLEGLDEDVLAVRAFADPFPVTELAEVVAVLHGRPTYSLIRGELHRRDPQWGALHSRYPCLVAHECGQSLPTRPRPPAPPQHADDNPPF